MLPIEVGQGHIRINGIANGLVHGEEEEENCPGKTGRTEERNIWYLVRCCKVSRQCHIIHSMYDTVDNVVYYTLFLVKF